MKEGPKERKDKEGKAPELTFRRAPPFDKTFIKSCKSRKFFLEYYFQDIYHQLEIKYRRKKSSWEGKGANSRP